ncbi:MAG TPA: DUF4442 domain-containing protein [Flavobacteriales bacterium]|nr:DUF4442 domain-containing protein [Flavobacteriales bacterium]HRO40387.1 DUF4442 domain-containing protein [Flavobacteriales bacterium]HRP82517.1 DUF4442 domain-containing protein [Flavobacteriales bacterium]HRQ84450.1 DUF4442 domain-containing protein [Flavobacteriales bacterium]
MELQRLIEHSRSSALARWWLNAVLRRMIPFNRPHGFRVVPMPSGGIRVVVPARRTNRNHIKGIHACCLATAAELCSGLALMEHLDPKHIRIIMKSLAMEYHYQAKSGAYAEYAPSAEELETRVAGPLRAGQAVLHEAEVRVCDSQGKHVATGRITWQMKPWDKVRTRV